MKQSDKLKELLEEIHKLAEESILYLPIMESLDHEEKEPLIKDEKIRKLLAEITELELVVNELNNRFNDFNKHYIKLCEDEE